MPRAEHYDVGAGSVASAPSSAVGFRVGACSALLVTQLQMVLHPRVVLWDCCPTDM